MAPTAIVGEKVGMSQMWVDDKVVPVTVLRVEPMRIVQVKTTERDGYTALQVTYGHRDAKKLNKPEAGHFAKAGVQPGKRLVELRLDSVDGFEVGQEITVDTLAAGSQVDVTAVSRGKGFAGTMKRHNFKGQGASHGNHKHHRAPGSIGSCAFPGRVFKGLKMSGHMGHEQVTTLNLEVVEADAERNLLLRQGLGPRPERRRRHRPQRRQERRRELSAMAQITLKTAAGKDAGNVELDDAMFGIQPNVPVMHQVVTAQLAARRAGTQSTKTRAEVRGGGAKPYRQKGTGNARQGSIRAPHFSGGGVALGPKPRKYDQKTPKKMIKLALRSALSDRAGEGKVVVVDALGLRRPEDQGRQGRARRARHRGPGARGRRPRRRQHRSQLPQPARGAADRARRAQRLRRAVQRLDRVHQGTAADRRPSDHDGSSGASSPRRDEPLAERRPRTPPKAAVERRGRPDGRRSQRSR